MEDHLQSMRYRRENDTILYNMHVGKEGVAAWVADHYRKESRGGRECDFS